MHALVVAAAAMAAEVLAVVNGKPITRADLEAALKDPSRQQYHEAVADLRDVEHAAARDYLGRQAAEREAGGSGTPLDSVYARVTATDFDHFDANLRNRIQQQRERVFGAERASLEDLIQQRLFEAAARARGMSPEQLTRALRGKVAPVTKKDLDFIKAYENSKQEATATIPPGEARLEAAITNARIEQLRMAVIDSVRGRAKVESRLAPPRVDVSTANAAVVGPPAAPVHIVVFTDFECPYCFEAEQTLAHLREKYGDRVALYYLNYPLPNHVYARPAAVAAMCAAAQGRYAEFHDFLFAHQQELAHANYAEWAAAAGLDRAAFEACEASGAADQRVDQDIREGIAAGVAATPTFLVNGRLVPDAEALQEVVAEEAGGTR
jgi:protein-disulfide isomerase